MPNSVLELVSAVLRREPERPVLVKADRTVEYGRVVEGMALLQQAGAQKVGFATESPGDRDRARAGRAERCRASSKSTCGRWRAPRRCTWRWSALLALARRCTGRAAQPPVETRHRGLSSRSCRRQPAAQAAKPRRAPAAGAQAPPSAAEPAEPAPEPPQERRAEEARPRPSAQREAERRAPGRSTEAGRAQEREAAAGARTGGRRAAPGGGGRAQARGRGRGEAQGRRGRGAHARPRRPRRSARPTSRRRPSARPGPTPSARPNLQRRLAAEEEAAAVARSGVMDEYRRAAGADHRAQLDPPALGARRASSARCTSRRRRAAPWWT